MIKHMDEYTILYQAKNYLTTEREVKMFLEKNMGVDKEQMMKCMESDSEMVRELALKWLEMGMNAVKYEYPPNVSKRMENYYNINKNYLAQELTPHIKKIMEDYELKIN